MTVASMDGQQHSDLVSLQRMVESFSHSPNLTQMNIVDVQTRRRGGTSFLESFSSVSGINVSSRAFGTQSTENAA